MIIADACNNHLGYFPVIEKMIRDCPADFIKFQMYDVNELSKDWKDDRPYYYRHQLTDEFIDGILGLCKDRNLPVLFTLFSLSQVDRAHRLGIKNVKVASPNAGVNALTSRCANEFDMCVISTGMSDDSERNRINAQYGDKSIILYCISRYPCVWTESEKEKAKSWRGISDHSENIDTAIWAVRNGLWVERHYTLGKDLPGRDHHISSTPDEFRRIVAEREYLKKVDKYKERWNG